MRWWWFSWTSSFSKGEGGLDSQFNRSSQWLLNFLCIHLFLFCEFRTLSTLHRRLKLFRCPSISVWFFIFTIIIIIILFYLFLLLDIVYARFNFCVISILLHDSIFIMQEDLKTHLQDKDNQADIVFCMHNLQVLYLSCSFPCVITYQWCLYLLKTPNKHLVFACSCVLKVKKKQGNYCIMFHLCWNLVVIFLVSQLTHLLYGRTLNC